MSLSKKTSKSKHLQMKLQRHHFLLSYLKTLSVGPVGVSNSQPLILILLNDRSISTLHKCNTFACNSFSNSCNSSSNSSRPRDNSRLNRKQHSNNRQLLSQSRQLLTRHNSRLSSRHSKQTPNQPSSHSLLEDR